VGAVDPAGPAVVVVAPDDDAVEQLANSAATTTALAAAAIRRVLELPVPICMLPPTLVHCAVAGAIRLAGKSSGDPSDVPLKQVVTAVYPHPRRHGRRRWCRR
jgi:hypothetical protein